MHLSATHYLRLAALFVFSLLIAACSGGGSYDGGTTTSSTPLTGGGVKGPMAGAVVQVYEIDFNGGTITRGRLAAEGSTNAQAQIVGLGFPFPTVFPYLVEFTSDADTIDLTTGQAPVISTLTTVVTAQLAAKGEQVYATPLTNMAVDIAFQNFDDFDGTTSSNNDDLKAALDAAAAQVASTVGFGLDANQIDIFDTPPLVDETVAIGSGEGDTPVADVSAYRAAVEALTAVVAQINEQSTDENSDPGAVLANLAKDLAGDGVIDGDDGSGNVVVEPTALDVLDQDPNTLPIPNTCADADKDANGVCNDGATPLTVDQVEEIVAAETADTGNEVSEQEQQEIANQETATQPAARNPDRDKDGVDNALDDFPDDPAADRDTDGDGQPDVAYFINQDGSRGDVIAGCDSLQSKSEPQIEDAQTMRPVKSNFRCSDDDDDADGVFDTVEAQDGTDPLDPDTDDDTISDGDEKALGSNPLFADSDEDGVNDPDDNCPVDENADQLDFDEDGVGAACDEDDRVAVPDADGDGVPDDSDNCPNDFNPAQTNTDGGFQSGDPAGDVCDDDDDGDGVNDADDEFPLNNSESADNDKDGIGDNADRDDDNDGLDDLEDDAPNDRDADDDGVLDGADEFPSDPNESRDTDGDQVGDNADTDDDNDNVSDEDEATQGTNPRVADTDRDGTNDGNDNCPVDANEDQTNSDDDELGDACDNDDDNDTVEDDADNCPVDANTDQTNSDDDALGNACDDDDDNDTVADEADNCPVDANTDQLNSDGDDQGNVCDDDDDNDDVADANDACPTTPQDLVGQVDSQGCAPGETDTDGDGVFDNVDNCPAIQNADQTDTDGDESGNVCDDDDDNDNVSDSDEATNGTDPLLADTDSDNTNDDTDNCPLTANEDQTDTDQDGDGNACDDDDDNDNVSDADEATNGTDPLLADTDSDDVNDDTDNCPLDANNDQANQDSDDLGDVCDDDRDGDGTNNEQDEFPDDASESADTDGDTIGDNADSCDNTPTGEEIDETGCSASERDTDGDGVNDNVDACPGTPAGSTLVENGCTQEQLEQTALGVFNSAGFDINVRGPTDADAAIEEIQLDAGLFSGVLTLSSSDTAGKVDASYQDLSDAYTGLGRGTNYEYLFADSCDTSDCLEDSETFEGNFESGLVYFPAEYEQEIRLQDFGDEGEQEIGSALHLVPANDDLLIASYVEDEFGFDVADSDDADDESDYFDGPAVQQELGAGLEFFTRQPTSAPVPGDFEGQYGVVGMGLTFKSNGDQVSEAFEVQFTIGSDGSGVENLFTANRATQLRGGDLSQSTETEEETTAGQGNGTSQSLAGDADGAVTLTITEDGESGSEALEGFATPDLNFIAFGGFNTENDGANQLQQSETLIALAVRRPAVTPSIAGKTFRLMGLFREIEDGGSTYMTALRHATLQVNAQGTGGTVTVTERHQREANDVNPTDVISVESVSYTNDVTISAGANGRFDMVIDGDVEVTAYASDTGVIVFNSINIVNGPVPEPDGPIENYVEHGIGVLVEDPSFDLDNNLPSIDVSTSAGTGTEVDVGNSLVLDAFINDADSGDTLTVEWFSTIGTITGATNAGATWNAPDSGAGTTVVTAVVSDGEEIAVDNITVSWSDPCETDDTGPTCDPDEDGVSNADEASAGTNPNDPDTDGDGQNDGDDSLPLDRDNDGRVDVGDNADDRCLDTESGATVDGEGCSTEQTANSDDDNVYDIHDECPGTTAAQAADSANFDNETGCHSDQLISSDFDGSYNALILAQSQGGPGDGAGEFHRYAVSEFEIERFTFDIETSNSDGSVSLVGDEANEEYEGAGVSRFGGGSSGIGDSFFNFSNDDDCSTPGECPFSYELERTAGLLVLPGFVDGEVDEEDENGETVHYYEVETAQRLSYLPLRNDGAIQAYVSGEFALSNSFDAEDVDNLANDPDNTEDGLESDLEPIDGGSENRFVFSTLFIATAEPETQLSQAALAGDYGLVNHFNAIEIRDGGTRYDFETTRSLADVTVDAQGAMTGNIHDVLQIVSRGDTGSIDVIAESDDTLSGSLTPDTEAGHVNFNITDSSGFAGFVTPDASLLVLADIETTEETESTDGSASGSYVVMLRKAAGAVDLSNSRFHLNMLAREYGQNYESFPMQVQHMSLDIGTTTTGCGGSLAGTVACYDMSIVGEDGHNFFEGRNFCDDNTGAFRCFGPLHTDGQASVEYDGNGDPVPDSQDYEDGQTFTQPGRLAINDSGDLFFEFFETNDNDEVVLDGNSDPVTEDSYRGYLGSNGAITFVGGDNGDGANPSYATNWVGIGLPALATTEQATLENRAPDITNISAQAGGQDVDADNPAAPGQGVVLTPTVTDEENDTLTYNWVGYAGSFSAQDTASTTWTAPSSPAIGSTKLELHVSDGLSTRVEFVDVFWGIRGPTDNEKAAALVVMDEGAQSPDDTIDWLLYVVPDSDELPNCQNTAGMATRTFTDNTPNNGSSDPFDPDVGDVVSVTFSDCVEGYNNFDNRFSGVNAGEFRMTITASTDSSYAWRVDVVNLEFVEGFCNGSVNDCTIEEKEIDSGVYVVTQTLTDTVSDFDNTAPADTTEQIDTFIDFTSYSTVEQELNDAGTAFVNTASFALKSPNTAIVIIGEYVDNSNNQDLILGYRLDLDYGYTGTATGSSSPDLDLDVATEDVNGLVQLVDEFENLQHMEGVTTITVNALSFADIAEDWTVVVEAIGSTSTNESEQEFDVTVDTDDLGAEPNFGFSATQQDVWDSDECDITPPSAGADCDE